MAIGTVYHLKICVKLMCIKIGFPFAERAKKNKIETKIESVSVSERGKKRQTHSSLNLIENRLSSILLNDIEVSPAFVHSQTRTHTLTHPHSYQYWELWITIKVPYVTHCWRCDTFYKTSFGIGTAIINLSTLFSPACCACGCVRACVCICLSPHPTMNSNIYLPTHSYEDSAGASVWSHTFLAFWYLLYL